MPTDSSGCSHLTMNFSVATNVSTINAVKAFCHCNIFDVLNCWRYMANALSDSGMSFFQFSLDYIPV